MSNIYILRHGEAGPAAPGFPDSSRTLTKDGFAGIKLQAGRLTSRAAGIEKIFCSPYTRTRQTAALIQSALDADMEIVNDLVPGGNAARILDLLVGMEEEVLLISHQPLVGELTMKLTGQAAPFHQGTCVKIEREDPMDRNGDMAWIIHPS